jgi:hypothetical protein
VQQLSLAAPQFVVPAPLTSQLGGASQPPALQFGVAAGHGTAGPHWPFDPHVSTPVPEHRVPVGVHAVELLDAELLLVELLELVDVPVLVLVAALLDEELLVVELPVLVEVTPPVIAELRELLVLVDVPVPVVPDVELP